MKTGFLTMRSRRRPRNIQTGSNIAAAHVQVSELEFDIAPSERGPTSIIFTDAHHPPPPPQPSSSSSSSSSSSLYSTETASTPNTACSHAVQQRSISPSLGPKAHMQRSKHLCRVEKRRLRRRTSTHTHAAYSWPSSFPTRHSAQPTDDSGRARANARIIRPREKNTQRRQKLSIDLGLGQLRRHPPGLSSPYIIILTRPNAVPRRLTSCYSIDPTQLHDPSAILEV